jgi:transposase
MSLRIKELEAMNGSLTEENEALRSGVLKLTKRLNKDSGNSSKPPSSDGFKKARCTSSREKSGKRPGGQPGHEGHTLGLFPNPDEIVEKEVSICDCGGAVLNDEGYDAKQIIDVKVTTNIREERVMTGRCTVCGKIHRGKFSDEYRNRAGYGNGIKALSLLLSERGFVPVGRTAEIINALTGCCINISEGTIVNFKREFAGMLDDEIRAITEAIENGYIVNVDETSCRNGGKKDWTQVISNEGCTLYGHNGKRGSLLIGGNDVLSAFTGTMIHDHFKAYYRYLLALHAECNVHILRYLKAITEFYHHLWADEMAKLLLEVNRRKKGLMDSGRGRAGPEEIKDIMERYEEILKEAEEEYKKETEGKKNIDYYDEERRLINRMKEFKEEHLRFFTDFRVPFGNNDAERDVGLYKNKMRVSGAFRSDRGADDTMRILSVISTAIKQGINIYEMIIDIQTGKHPFADALARKAS